MSCAVGVVYKVFLPIDEKAAPIRSCSKDDFTPPESLPFYLNDSAGNVHYYAATTDDIDTAVHAYEENRKIRATVQRWEADLETKQ